MYMKYEKFLFCAKCLLKFDGATQSCFLVNRVKARGMAGVCEI